ncbi:hypothetical protein ACQKWADRAFT_48789 [Trichoderma austrokoningii]
MASRVVQPKMRLWSRRSSSSCAVLHVFLFLFFQVRMAKLVLGTPYCLCSRYRIQQGAAPSSYILDQTSRTTVAPPDTGDPGRRELYEQSVQLH